MNLEKALKTIETAELKAAKIATFFSGQKINYAELQEIRDKKAWFSWTDGYGDSDHLRIPVELIENEAPLEQITKFIEEEKQKRKETKEAKEKERTEKSKEARRKQYENLKKEFA